MTAESTAESTAFGITQPPAWQWDTLERGEWVSLATLPVPIRKTSMTAEEAAEQCQARLVSKLPKGVSILVVLAIISAIFTVLTYCKASASEVKSRHGGILARYRLKKALREELREEGLKLLPDEINVATDAALAVAEEATEEEIEAFLQCCD